MVQGRVRVKFCGMTRKEDIVAAVHLGVDAIGLIFYEGSKRYIPIAQAQQLIMEIPPFVDIVAVVVNPTSEQINELLDKLPLSLLQFHGEETPEFCQQFNFPYIKTIHPTSRDQAKASAAEYTQAKALLLDTAIGNCRGGTGLPFDWHLVPKDLPKPLILAGGINEFNIQNAIEQVNPFAVDVCSGIEEIPGVKDHLKMNQFIKAVWRVYDN